MRTQCGKALPAVLVVIAALSVSACKEVEEESAAGYEPATLSPIKGKSEDYKRVTFTKDGARELKERSFDLEPIRAQGYAYERLDQLTMEILLGVR